MPDEEIPYETPNLRDAYRRGWNAWVENRLRPDRQLLGDGHWAKAWLDGYIDAEDAETPALMKNGLDEENPYSEAQAQRHEAWNEGFRAGDRGEPLPKRDNDAHRDTQTERARIEGYQAALEKKVED